MHGAAAAMGSLTGTNPIVAGTYVGSVTWFGRALAVAAGVALLVRLWGRQLPRTIWVWLLVLGVYWGLLAIAARPAEGSRYILVAAVLIVLIAADSVRRRLPDPAAVALLVLAAVALPANIVQLTKDRGNDTLHHDPPVSGTEFAMLELARDRVDPEYVVTTDPRVAEVDGGLFIGIPAGAYLDAASHNGSIARSLDEVRAERRDAAPDRRRLADRRARGQAEAGPAAARRAPVAARSPSTRAPNPRPSKSPPGRPCCARPATTRPASGWPASPTRQASASTTCPPAAGRRSPSRPTKRPTPGARRWTTRSPPAP